MTARALAGALSAVAALALCASAQAQNSYSFIDAAKSPVNYSLANATPQMKCADLRMLSTTDVTIISAQLMPAADGVPEHCRVTGNILPEIAFEVNLPSSWNRRFYMNGNGGYAGERPDRGLLEALHVWHCARHRPGNDLDASHRVRCVASDSWARAT